MKMMTYVEALQLENEIWNGNLMAYGIGHEDLARLSNLGWRWEAIATALPTAKIINPDEANFLTALHKRATEPDE